MKNGFWNGRRVAITGLNGFKGSWLALTLKLMGAEVSGIGIDPDWGPTILSCYHDELGPIRNDKVDVRKQALLQKTLEDCRPEILFHLAAQPLVLASYRDPIGTIETNILGTANLFEAIRKMDCKPKIVVNITSDKVYLNDDFTRSFREDDALGGKDIYSASKACAEILTKAYKSSFFTDITVCTARAGNVIGGGDWSADRIVPDIVRALQKGEQPLIRNPQATRPWQHVLEPISGYIELAEKVYADRQFEGSWNFGPPLERPFTVGQVYEEFLKHWPQTKLKAHQQKVDGKKTEANFLQVDSTKARAQLGWKSRLSFAESIEFTASWYSSCSVNSDQIISKTLNQIEEYYSKR